MQVQIRLFSVLRDCLPPDARRGRALIDLPEGTSLLDLFVRLGIDRRLGYEASEVAGKAGWQVLVNGSYEAQMQRVLSDGDEVQVFPPVVGG